MSKSIAGHLLANLRQASMAMPVSSPMQSQGLPPIPNLVEIEKLPSTQPVEASDQRGHDYDVRYLPLDRLAIDIRQPRQYLPPDLREQMAGDVIDALTVMKVIIERAVNGDTIASRYLEQTQELAHNIRDVGLQQPLRVSEEQDRNQRTIFRIVDGERRYWAYVWLSVVSAATEHASQPFNIPVILHNVNASADEIRRAQWAANLHRADIPAVDYAEVVWQVREDYFSRLAVDRQRYTHELGTAAEGLSLHDIAALLTAKEVEWLTGRTLKRSSLYLYLAIAEKLKATPKALARAHGLSLRQLRVVVRLSETQQTEAILGMIAANQSDTLAQTQPSNLPGSPGRPGRPTSLQRSVNLCINLAHALQKLSNKALVRQTPEDQQALLSELDAAAAEIDRTRKLIKTRLST